MFACVFYNFGTTYHFPTLLEAIKYGSKAGFEFYVQDENFNIVYQ